MLNMFLGLMKISIRMVLLTGRWQRMMMQWTWSKTKSTQSWRLWTLPLPWQLWGWQTLEVWKIQVWDQCYCHMRESHFSITYSFVIIYVTVFIIVYLLVSKAVSICWKNREHLVWFTKRNKTGSTVCLHSQELRSTPTLEINTGWVDNSTNANWCKNISLS